MNNSPNESPSPGRVNAVFVFGKGESARAVVSRVIVKIFESGHPEENRVRFSGVSMFHEKTADHVRNVVLPCLDRILQDLGIPLPCLDISAVNLGAASTLDVGISVSGFSADVPVFLAGLSAILSIPVPESIIATGHIDSFEGDVSMVRRLPEKLICALGQETINTFIMPAIHENDSLSILTPREKVRILDAVYEARKSMDVIEVSNVKELTGHVFSDEQVALSGLKHGFYGKKRDQDKGSSAGAFFLQDNEKRFWKVLENSLTGKRPDAAHELLASYCRYHIGKKIYPSQFGKKLRILFSSLPPHLQNSMMDSLDLPVPEFIRLGQYATETDLKDVQHLLSSNISLKSGVKPAKEKERGVTESDDKLGWMISEISPENLTRMIGLPIDTARAVFPLDGIIVESYHEFNRIVTSFYIHILMHLERISEPDDMSMMSAEAHAVLERAYAKKGGLNAALAEARSGLNAGLKHILDVFADQLKYEVKEKYINLVFKTALDPLDWDAKVAFMKSILDYLKPYLPNEIAAQPPERFCGHYEVIVRNIVQSSEHITSIFRTL